MTYAQVTAKLPTDAKWSCSFGNPGEAGYNEYYRDVKGNRYLISNGKWNESGKEWSIEIEVRGSQS